MPPEVTSRATYRHRAWRRYSYATRRLRERPTFLVLGGQRCGTTFLYECLRSQPGVMGAREKEVHFFDLQYHRGFGWYRSHFPTAAAVRARSASGVSVAVGEASPYYLFHPGVPGRVAACLPDARFIVLVRNPADRAYSHYRHERRLGHEPLEFEQALEAEEHRLAGEEERLLRDPRYASFPHRHHSYFARGCYAAQLRRWLDVFPRERFLVLASETLFADPGTAVRRALDFLGLSGDVGGPPPGSQGSPQAPLPTDVRANLIRRYAEPNAELAQLLAGRASVIPWIASPQR
ncbi:MAG TPA: sulfotransferase [Gaiellales bacterium]|nr:sulfotransferase [Gaiellales bacterium]